MVIAIVEALKEAIELIIPSVSKPFGPLESAEEHPSLQSFELRHNAKFHRQASPRRKVQRVQPDQRQSTPSEGSAQSYCPNRRVFWPTQGAIEDSLGWHFC